MERILEVRRDAIFIQSESSEYFHAENPAAIKPAEIMNSKRFLSLDLNYGRRINSEMYEFVMDNGMTREEYHFFLSRSSLRHHCIMGNDYYVTNEHRVHANGATVSAGDIFGYDEITRQYYDRYMLPVMHTETNLMEGPRGDEAVNWLWKQWANVLRVRNTGVPILGFTWYSLTDQMDWDTALREENNRVSPVGLYDLDRNIRPVGTSYKQLIEDWCDVLPAQSVCLTLPLTLPQEYEEERADAAASRAGDRKAVQRDQKRHPTGFALGSRTGQGKGSGTSSRDRNFTFPDHALRRRCHAASSRRRRRREDSRICWSIVIAISIFRTFRQAPGDPRCGFRAQASAAL